MKGLLLLVMMHFLNTLGTKESKKEFPKVTVDVSLSPFLSTVNGKCGLQRCLLPYGIWMFPKMVVPNNHGFSY